MPDDARDRLRTLLFLYHHGEILGSIPLSSRVGTGLGIGAHRIL